MSESAIQMFGPLTFEDIIKEDEGLNRVTPCLLCDDTFNLKLCFDIFLKHCFDVHSLVIDDVQNIDDIHTYIEHWKDVFKHKSIDTIIPSVQIGETDIKYYFLSGLIKEDKQLRHKLKLQETLKQQEFERTDTNYRKTCLFCKLQFQGSRADYVHHLSNDHHFNIGNPQNLVYIDMFIQEIEDKLNDFQCIYCEKTFPDRAILKEHMRKKGHKLINPQNKHYDKYYMINYLEPDIKWTHIVKEEDAISLNENPNSDTEYADWKEKEEEITCLFCSTNIAGIFNICAHMLEIHKFDFKVLTDPLSYYQRLKLINYIRRQMFLMYCIFCNEYCGDYDSLTRHMIEKEHYKLPPLPMFDQPEYYFSTYENDTFLYNVEDIDY